MIGEVREVNGLFDDVLITVPPSISTHGTEALIEGDTDVEVGVLCSLMVILIVEEGTVGWVFGTGNLGREVGGISINTAHVNGEGNTEILIEATKGGMEGRFSAQMPGGQEERRGGVRDGLTGGQWSSTR
jgi:hypothetical protein